MSENQEKVNKSIEAETDPSLDMSLRETEVDASGNQTETVVSIKQEEDPYLKEAIEYGYDPNFKGPNKKTPKEFVEFGKNYNREETLKSIKSELSALRDETRRREEEYKRIITEQELKQVKIDLEKQLNLAKAAGNMQAVEDLTAKKTEMAIQSQHIQQQQTAAQKMKEEAEANMQFAERNSHWYNETHPELQAEAKTLGAKYFQDFPTASYKDAIMHVEKMMHWNHPEIATPSSKPALHISSSTSNTNKSAADSSTASSEAQAIKALTPDQLAEFKEIKARFDNPSRKVKITYTVQDYLKVINKLNQRI